MARCGSQSLLHRYMNIHFAALGSWLHHQLQARFGDAGIFDWSIYIKSLGVSKPVTSVIVTTPSYFDSMCFCLSDRIAYGGCGCMTCRGNYFRVFVTFRQLCSPLLFTVDTANLASCR